MKTLYLLENDDLIEPTDWCRPLRIVTMGGGISDDYSFKSCYSGTPENNIKWVRVCDVFGPVWKGKSIKQLNAMYYDNPTNRSSALTVYEIVRGDVPKEHQLDIKGYSSMKNFWK